MNISLKNKITIIMVLCICSFILVSCKANVINKEYKNIINTYKTQNTYIAGEDNKKDTWKPTNYINEPGVCIEDTDFINCWILPNTNSILSKKRITDEKLYETGTLIFEAKAGAWNGITKAINYDFTDIKILALAFYIDDQYAFDSCKIQLSSSESNARSNSNNWKKYCEAKCGFTSTRLHRGWNYIKLTNEDFTFHGDEKWGLFKALRIIVDIPSYKFNHVYSGMTDEKVESSIFGIGGIYLDPSYEKPKLMFNFDDSSLSLFTNGFPYLEEKGIKGTLFVCFNHIVENGGSIATMNEAQHDELYKAGWDIGNHSTTHGDIYAMTEDEIYWEYKTNRDFLVGKGWLTGGLLSAPPNGRNNYITNKVLYDLGYRFVRGNKAYYIDGITPDSIMQFPTFEIRSDTPVKTTMDRIDNAIKRGSSISIFTHHIVESDPDLYSTTIKDFKEVVDYAVIMRDAGLIDIVTMSEFYYGLSDKSIAQRGY